MEFVKLDGEEKCPECNWLATTLVDLGDGKGTLCADCFIQWLIKQKERGMETINI